MKEITITMEKISRVEHTFEISDREYNEIKKTNRISDALFNWMSEIIDDTEGDTEYDYAVFSETEQKEIIEWG